MDRTDRFSWSSGGKIVRAIGALVKAIGSTLAGVATGTVVDMPQFEVFRKRMAPLVKQPYVTIQHRGTMSFNKAAHHALGSPEAIELLFDPNEQIIGVRAVDPRVEHAYPIRVTNAETSFIVSGRAFTHYYGIPTDISRRYPAEILDGVLCIDLKGGGTEVTSNRKGRTKAATEGSNGAQRDLGAVFNREIAEA